MADQNDVSKLDSLDGVNSPVQIARAIIARIAVAPERFAPIIISVEEFLKWLIKDNIELLKRIKSEDELFDCLTEILDTYIVLKGVFEMIDGPAIKMILKKAVDPLLDKYAGATWFNKFQNLLTTLENEMVK